MDRASSSLNPCSVEDFAKELSRLPQSAFNDVSLVLQVVSSFQVSSESLESYLLWDNSTTRETSFPVAVDPQNPVHRVYNPAEFRQRAVSLHVYSKPFDECVVYSEERGTCGIVRLQYTKRNEVTPKNK